MMACFGSGLESTSETESDSRFDPCDPCPLESKQGSEPFPNLATRTGAPSLDNRRLGPAFVEPVPVDLDAHAGTLGHRHVAVLDAVDLVRIPPAIGL